MIEVVGVNDFATKGTKGTKLKWLLKCPEFNSFVALVPFVANLFGLPRVARAGSFVAKRIARIHAVLKSHTGAQGHVARARPAWVVDDSTSSRASEDRNFFALPRWCGRAK